MKAFKTLGVLAGVVLLALVLLPGDVLAAFAPTRILNLYVLNKLLVGTSTEANAVTKSFSASSTIDFASVTTTCVDSSGITVTGAVAGDACFVGTPAAATANLSFTCYVSAADTVKVRACAAGTAADAASATYYVRVVSAQ
jgi:hypothetical protein